MSTAIHAFMPLTAGTRVGSYQVIALIGVGGMGEVYRARDTTLNRDIALKVLPESLASEPARLTLFRREAQVLASLNHPNIAHIHGIEETETTFALVMELVEGPTLADRLVTGALPLTEVLPIARQIAEALELAHERGVVHRDLKPANIKVRFDGTVKVLDFGIAKALDPAAAGEADPMSSPAFMATLTLPGALLGTAAFMSPEQARGKVVDRRTDIWAFGAVVYEMLTGIRLFGGDGLSETLAAVLTRPVDWTTLPADTPLALRRLLARCLDRDLKMRLRDIGEARIEIARMAGAPDGPVVGATPLEFAGREPGLRRWAPWSVAGVSTVAFLVVLAMWAPWTTRPPAQPVRFALVPSAALPVTVGGIDPMLAISPDGAHVAYAARTAEANLVVRQIGQLMAAPLPGIFGASQPFFSPDGTWVAFSSGTSELRKVRLSGGPAVTVCAFPLMRGASWGPNGVIYVGSLAIGGGLYAVPEGGGEPRRLTVPDLARGEVAHVFPFVLPGGNAVLFTITDEDVMKNQIAVIDLRTGVITKLFRGGSAPTYVRLPGVRGEQGVLVYAASGSLRAYRFDLGRLDIVGNSIALGEPVTMEATGASQYSVSGTGTLLIMPGGQTTRNVPRSLEWVDRNGRVTPILAPVRSYTAVTLSPDGTTLALDVRDQGQDVWTWGLERQKLERFTIGPGSNAFPIWTPDSRMIIFGGLQGGLVQSLFSQPAIGTGAPRRLTTATGSQSPTTISPDGAHVLFREVTAQTGEDIGMLTLSTGVVTSLFRTPHSERSPAVSPNGRFVAFEWSESGRPQIYVAPFPNVTSGRWQVTDATTGTGAKPVWSPNGRELFFIGRDGLYRVAVETTADFSSGTPVRLFPVRDFLVNGGRYYDVSRDGQRFIVIKDLTAETRGDVPPPGLVVAVHWIEDVKTTLGIR